MKTKLTQKQSKSVAGEMPRENVKKNGFKGGADHINWKGDNIKYSAMHIWVRKWKGRYHNYCERCGTTENRQYDWANIDHKYRRVLEDYISMCVPCHRKYDFEKGLSIAWGHNGFTDKALLNKERKNDKR